MSSTENLLSLQRELMNLQRKHDVMFENLIRQSLEMTDANERKLEEQRIETTLRVQIRVVGQRINSLEKYLEYEEESASEDLFSSEYDTSSDDETSSKDSETSDVEDEESSDKLEEIQSKQTEIENLNQCLFEVYQELEKSNGRGQELEKQNEYQSTELNKLTSKLFEYIARYPQFVSQKTVEELNMDVSICQAQIEHLKEEVTDLKKLLSTLIDELIYLNEKVKKQKEKADTLDQGVYAPMVNEEYATMLKSVVKLEVLDPKELDQYLKSRELGNEFYSLMNQSTRYKISPTPVNSRSLGTEFEALRKSLQYFQAGQNNAGQEEEESVKAGTEFGAFLADDYVYVESHTELNQEEEDDDFEVEEVPMADEAQEVDQGIDMLEAGVCLKELAQWREGQTGEEPQILVENRSRNGREAAEFFMFIAIFVFTFCLINKLLSHF